MEKDPCSIKPNNYYGRIRKAITFSNPLQQAPSSPPPTNYPNAPEHRTAFRLVPIEFDHSVFSKVKPNQPILVGLKDKLAGAGGEPASVVGGKKKTEQEGSNEGFSDYIKRAKMKMKRSMTMFPGDGGVGGKGVSRLESINKKTSAYIDRARGKMKTASVSGGQKPE